MDGKGRFLLKGEYNKKFVSLLKNCESRILWLKSTNLQYGEIMLIDVIFENGQKGRVTEEMLNYLLEEDALLSFKRQKGWVRPDSDSVRRRSALVFSIPERRAAVNELLKSDAPLSQDMFH